MKPFFRPNKYSYNAHKKESLVKVIIGIIVISISIYSFRDFGVRLLLIIVLLLLLVILIVQLQMLLIERKKRRNTIHENKYKEAIEWDEKRRKREYIDTLYGKYPIKAQAILDRNLYVEASNDGWALPKSDTLLVLDILEAEKVFIHSIYGTTEETDYYVYYDNDYSDDNWTYHDKKEDAYFEIRNYINEFSVKHEQPYFIFQL